MRERLVHFVSVTTFPGITPARAGKTCRYGAYRPAYWDHPRSCGKDTLKPPCPRSRPGSPPLVRERPRPGRRIFARTRITPARAGKTRQSGFGCTARGDHPRSCGKDSISASSDNSIGGSPPLVRERQGETLWEIARPRITPARAGKTRGRKPLAGP